MTEYVFLVPTHARSENGEWVDQGGWVQATIDGMPIKTTISDHFGGRMPLILATEHMHYISLEEHIADAGCAG